MFEGFGDNAVTSTALFTKKVPHAVLLHDLIPWIHKSIYLTNPVFEDWYLRKLDSLRRVDLILTNSQSTAKEATDVLGFANNKVVNINSACESHFKPITPTILQYHYLNKKYRISKPFVMYTGGIDYRKNIEGLIRAYANLPKHLRDTHQLAIVCSIQKIDRERLTDIAKLAGLAFDELIITGFVTEEDLVLLYNTCKLFVFPSWHEGFGLPALEAMACGKAVIGANTSSIPEVIGNQTALFDPYDDQSIKRKIEEVLVSDSFRAELEQHGLEQSKKFSWTSTGQRAWDAINLFLKEANLNRKSSVVLRRPKLAYFSPLPNQKSGISDYSAELLPELSSHYEIDIIANQDVIFASWIHANCPIRTLEWFKENYTRFDRIIYHFGNSEFHSHMFDLLQQFDGVVVLHDFFLSGIVAHLDLNGTRPNSWSTALYQAHGWKAVQERYLHVDTAPVVYRYPANIEVLQTALGIIVHSESSRRLANSWYGENASVEWGVIPLLRVPPLRSDRLESRKHLSLAEADTVVCSFGLLGPTKLNRRLLEAWFKSGMSKNKNCRLVFIGQNHNGDYGIQMAQLINDEKSKNNVFITGWTDATTYRRWLEAADIGVQLRTLSRGETSAAVLDCMNYGIATIVNANGSMADIPNDAVLKLADEFTDDQLAAALDELWNDKKLRASLSFIARKHIRKVHNGRVCAEQYYNLIEDYYEKSIGGLPSLINKIASNRGEMSQDNAETIATHLANNFPLAPRKKQLLVDISELVQRDAKSGIQRVVRALLRELLLNPPDGYAIEPVYATTEEAGYRYARKFISKFLGIPSDWAADDRVNAWKGDTFLGLDLQPSVVPFQSEFLLAWYRRGISVRFVVYDLIPVLMPHVFPDVARASHHRWLEVISQFDAAICISKAVADEFLDWLEAYGPVRKAPLLIDWFHLGADVENSVPTKGVPSNSESVFSSISKRTTFVTVGTLEPRKGHAQLLNAFEALWDNGSDVNLIIIGKQGWLVEDLIESIRSHKEIGNRLFWLDSISDEYLEMIYKSSSCLILASEGEGFGLPLIEAAQHNLPIIARDIPVFREVAGEHCYYFSNSINPESISSAVEEWIRLYSLKKHPLSTTMPWLNWKASSKQLMASTLTNNLRSIWRAGPDTVYWATDGRLLNQCGEKRGRFVVTSGVSGFLIHGPNTFLEAGSYEINYMGSSENLVGSEFIDIASGSGKNIHTEVRCIKDEDKILNTSHKFRLENDVADAEFRLWVSDKTMLNISKIIVKKLKN